MKFYKALPFYICFFFGKFKSFSPSGRLMVEKTYRLVTCFKFGAGRTYRGDGPIQCEEKGRLWRCSISNNTVDMSNLS